MLPPSVVNWFRALPGPARAGVHATTAALFFGVMSGFIRAAGEELHPFVIVFFRNALALLIMVPWIVRHAAALSNSRRLASYALRSTIGLGSMISGFAAVTLMPLSEATALSFTAPLFSTLLAALLLGEVVRARRWTAIVIGFAGTMLVLRPGAVPLSTGAVLALVNAALMAVNNLVVKSLARTEPPDAIVTFTALLLTPMSLVPAVFVWQWPSPATLLLLIGLAAVGTAGHLFWTRAFAAADVSVVLPFDFTRLPFTALVAFLAFGEVPVLWTWLGGAVIFASTFYIAIREAQLARRSRPR